MKILKSILAYLLANRNQRQFEDGSPVEGMPGCIFDSSQSQGIYCSG